MAAAGYPQLKDAGVQRYESESTRLVLDVGRALGYTSEADARSRGFGKSARAEPAPVVSFDPNFDQAKKTCDEKVAVTLGTGQRGLVDQYVAMGNILNVEFGTLWARPRFQADLAVQADCIAADGHSVRDRDAFIKNDMSKAFGVTLGTLEDFPGSHWEPNRVPGTVAVGPPIPARRYVPSAAEAELAVAWYQCDQKSGRADKFLADARTQAETILAKYEDQFAELNPQIEELAAKAAALVQ
jgi:hypothetical protein